MLALRHLRTLDAVVRAGGIRASSEPLLRAPSAVSRAIGLLEAALAAPLFERRSGGLVPTALGEMVQARARFMADELAAVADDASAARGRSAPAAALDALFDERRLRAASLLAEVHHMPTVARRLGVTQPAVSAAVARLESALGTRLFARTPRGLVPTDAGARWVVRFERVLAELRYLEDDVAATRGAMEGTITVGALPLARTRVLPMAIDALLARHPRVSVHALESPYEQLAAGLLSGKVDFIVGALRPLADRALQNETLFIDRLGLIASAAHPLAARARVDWADLARWPWVLSRPGTPLRESLARFFESHGQRAPHATVETGDQALVRGLLLQGRMLTVLSTHQLRHELDAGQLRVLRFPMEGLQREIGITTRTGARLPAAAAALVEEIRRVGR